MEDFLERFELFQEIFCNRSFIIAPASFSSNVTITDGCKPDKDSNSLLYVPPAQL
ncbi:MAG: hypothetical protein ACR5KV_03285 [Wolbachia sp.]